MTVRAWLTQTAQSLASAKIECSDPQFHAKQILEACAGWNSAQILKRMDEELPKDTSSSLNRFLSRRLEGEPFQYIVGRESFWKDDFEVGPGVLIPRPDTETLVEFLASLKRPTARVVELGAGSSNVGVSALREHPTWTWWACEKSTQAFDFSRRNGSKLLGNQARAFESVAAAQDYGNLHRRTPSERGYNLVHGDFFELAPLLGPWDLIVSNPPYVAEGEIDKLSMEVRHEPRAALSGGTSGLVIIEKLAQFGKNNLMPGGQLVLEIGNDQGRSALEILNTLGYEGTQVLEDLGERPRVVVGSAPK